MYIKYIYVYKKYIYIYIYTSSREALCDTQPTPFHPKQYQIHQLHLVFFRNFEIKYNSISRMQPGFKGNLSILD